MLTSSEYRYPRLKASVGQAPALPIDMVTTTPEEDRLSRIRW